MFKGGIQWSSVLSMVGKGVGDGRPKIQPITQGLQNNLSIKIWLNHENYIYSSYWLLAINLCIRCVDLQIFVQLSLWPSRMLWCLSTPIPISHQMFWRVLKVAAGSPGRVGELFKGRVCSALPTLDPAWPSPTRQTFDLPQSQHGLVDNIFKVFIFW